jgi:hypothetical protein
MYLTHYAFDGNPDVLAAARQALLAEFPPDALLLHIAVRRPDGIDVYDACPDEQTARAFADSPEFLGVLDRVGLPRPRVTLLGEVVQVVHPAAVAG